MEIKVLFNSEAISKKFSTGWGLSLLINEKILFDTGEKGDLLLNNINNFKVNLKKIKSVVISHDHWDHTGGLWNVLKKNPKLDVFGCPGFSEEFKRKVSELSAHLIEAEHFMRINTEIYSTGEIVGTYKDKNIAEQSLIIKTNKGFSVITGCAHPGIINILKKIKSQLSIEEFYSVIGGFHLRDHSVQEIQTIVDQFLKFKVNRVGATHCSGADAEKIFQEVYRDRFYSMKVGESITI